MRVIHKHALNSAITELSLTDNDHILGVQIQNDIPVMWVIHDKAAKKNKVLIHRLMTGQEIPNNLTENDYLGTVQYGALVLHFFIENKD